MSAIHEHGEAFLALRNQIDAEQPALEAALLKEAEHPQIRREMLLRLPLCAAATGLLSVLLEENHGVVTERRAARFSHLGAIHSYAQDEPLPHLVLHEPKTGATIDPTYTQFFRYVGLTPWAAREDAEINALYPERAIAVIDEVLFGREYTRRASEIRDQVRCRLGGQGVAMTLPDGMLMNAPDGLMTHIYSELWLPRHYRAHPLSGEQRDHIESLLTS